MDPILVQTRVETVMLKRTHRSGLRALRGFHQNYTPSVNQALKSSQTVISNLDHWTFSAVCLKRHPQVIKEGEYMVQYVPYVCIGSRWENNTMHTLCTFDGILCALVMLIPSFSSNMCKSECHRYCMGVILWNWKRAHGQEISNLTCSLFSSLVRFSC